MGLFDWLARGPRQRLPGDDAQPRGAEAARRHDPPAIAPLVAALGGRSPDEAAQALVEIGQAAVEPVTLALETGDWGTRREAAWILGQLQAHSAVPRLVHALSDPDGFVPARAAEALRRIGWNPSTPEEKVAYAVATEDWETLGTYGAPAVDALRRRFKGPHSWTMGAARALARAGGTAVVADFTKILGNEGAPKAVRDAAVEALVEIGPTVAESLAPLLQQGNTSAAEVLARIGSAGLSAPNAVRVAIIRDDLDAIATLGEAAVEPLLALLRAESSSRREPLMRALARTRSARAVPALVPILTEDSNQAPLAARLLAEMDARESVPALLAAIEENAAAIDVLGKWRVAEAIVPLIDMVRRTTRQGDAPTKALVAIGAPAVDPLEAVLRRELCPADAQAERAWDSLVHVLAALAPEKAARLVLERFQAQPNSIGRLKPFLPLLQPLDSVPHTLVVGLVEHACRWGSRSDGSDQSAISILTRGGMSPGCADDLLRGVSYVIERLGQGDVLSQSESVAAVRSLCARRDEPVSTDLLHLVARIEDAETWVQEDRDGGHHFVVSFEEQRQLARLELQARGAPPYAGLAALPRR